jgi:hypothetical protein
MLMHFVADKQQKTLLVVGLVDETVKREYNRYMDG